jgi:hypothetical protein
VVGIHGVLSVGEVAFEREEKWAPTLEEGQCVRTIIRNSRTIRSPAL